MLYTTFTVDNTEYKCRLGAAACIDLEKKLGTNPLNILAKASATNEMPELETLLMILQASLQKYHHGMGLIDVYELYDKFVDEGKTIVDLMPIIIDIFKVSGFFNEKLTDSKN